MQLLKLAAITKNLNDKIAFSTIGPFTCKQASKQLLLLSDIFSVTFRRIGSIKDCFTQEIDPKSYMFIYHPPAPFLKNDTALNELMGEF